ncbi:uncharacterized protein LOC121374292 [Gigantopelta aegis]|uniref:uncharacterized protein LOC121374292 n=1 Tax=Gigantopelta aegis TaxID=1735272 RepID=UPI001B88B394|nr:uncharacterized protein LOC121374292 [Gigantopelta aegis]
MAKPRRASLNSLDTPRPSTPFRHQKVVSYQLFYQEQKARLGSLYTFLTREQINLKIKDKWKQLETNQKKNYTKAILCVTPLKKPILDLKLASSTPKYSSAKKKGSSKVDSEVSSLLSTSPSPVISSQEKVQHWLNDPKHDVLGNSKKYEATQYALNYGIPEIIEETPDKPTGILKNNSFRNSSEVKIKSKNNSRVSFSPRNNKTKSYPSKSKITMKVSNLTDVPCIGRQKKTLIKDKDVFDFDVIDNVELYIEDEISLNPEVKNQSMSSSKLTSQKKKTARKSFNFEDDKSLQNKQVQLIKPKLNGNVSKQTLNTPENKKKQKPPTPIAKMLRCPKKQKAQNSKSENEREPGKIVLNKQLRPQKDISELKLNLKHRPRTDTHAVKQRLRPRHKQFSPEYSKSNRFKSNSLQEDQSTEHSTFYRNRKGLLVGPIIYGGSDNVSAGLSPSVFDDRDANFDDQGANSDNHGADSDDDYGYYTNHKGLIFGPISDGQSFTKKNEKKEYVKDSTVAFVSKKEKGTLVDKVFPKQTKTYTQRRRTISGNAQQIQKPSNALYSSNSEKTVPKANRSKSYRAEITNCKKCLKKDNDMGDSLTVTNSKFSRQKNTQMLLNDKLHQQKPSSPASSIPWEADNSVKDLESLSIASTADLELVHPQMTQSKTTLAQVLSRMQQITSPIQMSLESSPRLLSPTLSGISQLTSLSEKSSNHSEKVLRQVDERKSILRSFHSQNQKQGTIIPQLSSLSEEASNQSEKMQRKQMEERKPNLRFNSQNGKTKSRQSTVSKKLTTHVSQEKDLLCDMFQDVTPPEKKKMKLRERRLVASNKEAKMLNFETMFDERDIFL